MKDRFTALTQHYRDMSLQAKFTLALVIAVTIPVLMFGFFFYNRLYDMVVSYTIQQEQDASAKTSPIIEETVQKVKDTSDRLSELTFFDTLFHMPVHDSFSSLASSALAEEFKKEVDVLTDGELITAIRIYLDLPSENNPLFTYPSTKEIFAPMSQARGTYWHGIFQGNSNIQELYCPSFYLGAIEQEEYGDMAYIWPISLYHEGTPLTCYAAVYYSSDEINAILSENLGLEGSVSYIVNDRDSLVASSDRSLSGIYWIGYESIEESVMSSNNFIERSILDEKVYASFYRISQPGWFMVTILPSRPLIEQSNNLMVQYIFWYIAFLILAVVFANILAHSITNRISSVISQMQKIRQGPPVPMESPVTHDEIGDLIDTYNYMTRKMSRLIEDQARAAEELRIAEFNSLQAQINPHFLYNTMDMINWLAQQGRTDEVSSAVQNLSRFYKLTLSRKKSISTIAQEEEHVSIYIRLQNMRYHDSISFVSDIPDELMEYQIPKLTLQPVIENAVLHGILEKDSKTGTIVLTGWMEDEDIVLLISDDGVGIPPEKLSQIISGTGNTSSKGTNIAVYNAHRRLQILYGKEYGLSYSSMPGMGTEVQIRIPAQKEYQSPYIHNSAGHEDKPFFPLISVSDQRGGASAAVSPETLLSYSQKLTQDLYNIQNLHQLSKKLPENENLYILTHNVTSDFPSHTHTYFELNYVCSGSLINVIDDNEIYMAAGDLVFLNKDAVHSLKYQQPDTLMINFCLNPELFDRTLKAFIQEENLISDFFRGTSPVDNNYIFFSLGHSLHAQSILTSIIQEYADNGFHQSFALEGFFLLLFSYLISAEEFSYCGIDAQTHYMVEYLTSHCMKDSLKDIAAHFQYSEEQFDCHIRSRTGRSCESFVQERRLNMAVEMLGDPKVNIYQIVEKCGYRDAEEFFEIFHKRFHISPPEYRKQFL